MSHVLKVDLEVFFDILYGITFFIIVKVSFFLFFFVCGRNECG